MHQRIPCKGHKWGYDCYTPSMFFTKADAELFSNEFKQSLQAAIQTGIKDISEHPWIAIFIEKVKQCRHKPEHVSKWIADYEGKSGTSAKRTASKQTGGGEEVEEEGEVPRAVGNDDASKKQRNSGRLGGNNGGSVLGRSFTLRDRDKVAHVREKGKQELAILNTNEREEQEKLITNLQNAQEKFTTLYGAKQSNHQYTLLYKTTENDGIESIYGKDVNRGWLTDAEYNRVAFICDALLCFYKTECEQFKDALNTGNKAPCRPFDEVIESMKKDVALYESAQEELPEEKRVKGLEMSVTTLRKYVKLFEENDGIPESRKGKKDRSTLTQFPQIGIEMLDYGQ